MRCRKGQVRINDDLRRGMPLPLHSWLQLEESRRQALPRGSLLMPSTCTASVRPPSPSAGGASTRIRHEHRGGPGRRMRRRHGAGAEGRGGGAARAAAHDAAFVPRYWHVSREQREESCLPLLRDFDEFQTCFWRHGIGRERQVSPLAYKRRVGCAQGFPRACLLRIDEAQTSHRRPRSSLAARVSWGAAPETAPELHAMSTRARPSAHARTARLHMGAQQAHTA